MPKPSVYLESSVPSYYTARLSRDIVTLGHQETTREWWETAIERFEVFVSELVLREIGRGDPDAAKLRLSVLDEFKILPITNEALRLADIYLAFLPIPASAEADALHLAISSLGNVDYLLTWNCRHIANGFVISELALLNEKLGVMTPVICTPEELMYENPRNSA